MSDSVNFPGRLGTALGTLGEPKNSLKIDFLRKNGVPNVLFRRFLCTKLVSTLLARFSVDFSRKIDEKSMKKTTCFSHRRLFFSTWRPSRNIVFYDAKAISHFLCFSKNIKKVIQTSIHVFPSRTPKSRPRGSVLGPKIVPNSRQRGRKSQKLCGNSVFRPRHFWNIFWRGFGLEGS